MLTPSPLAGGSSLRPRGSPGLSDPDLVHPPGKARCPRSTIPSSVSLRTRPAGLPQQGVATSVARPVAAHLTKCPSLVRIQRGSLPLGSTLVPAGGRRRGLGCGRERDAASRGAGSAPGSPNGALPTAPAPAGAPPPSRARPDAGQWGARRSQVS